MCDTLASSKCKPTWRLADVAEKIKDQARCFGASFYHVKCSTNSRADTLAKDGLDVRVCLLILVANPLNF